MIKKHVLNLVSKYKLGIYTCCFLYRYSTLQWRHNDSDGISNLKSPLFNQQLVQVEIKENIKTQHHWTLSREFIVHHSLHKRPVMWKMFPFDDIIMIESRLFLIKDKLLTKYKIMPQKHQLKLAENENIICNHFKPGLRIHHILWWILCWHKLLMATCPMLLQPMLWPITAAAGRRLGG